MVIQALHRGNRDSELMEVYKWAYGLYGQSNPNPNSNTNNTNNSNKSQEHTPIARNMFEQRNYIWNYSWFRNHSHNYSSGIDTIGTIGTSGSSGISGDISLNTPNTSNHQQQGLSYSDTKAILQSCLLLNTPYDALCCYHLYMNKVESKVYSHNNNSSNNSSNTNSGSGNNSHNNSYTNSNNNNNNNNKSKYGYGYGDTGVVVPISKPTIFALDTTLEQMRLSTGSNIGGSSTSTNSGTGGTSGKKTKTNNTNNNTNNTNNNNTPNKPNNKNRKIQYNTDELQKIEAESELCTYLLMTMVSKTNPIPHFNCSTPTHKTNHHHSNSNSTNNNSNKSNLGGMLLSLGVHLWEESLKNDIIEKMLGMAMATATKSSTGEHSSITGYTKTPSYRAQWFDQVIHRDLYIGKLRIGINSLENSILFAVLELGCDLNSIIDMLRGTIRQNRHYQETQFNSNSGNSDSNNKNTVTVTVTDPTNISNISNISKLVLKDCILLKLMGDLNDDSQAVFKQRLEYLIRQGQK